MNHKKTNCPGASHAPKSGIRKVRKLYCGAVLTLILAMVCAVPAFAEGDALTILTNLNDMIFSIVRLVGIAGAIWGIVQLGMSISGHDPSQRLQGVLTLVGSLIIIFSKEILQAIGAM